MHRGCKYCRLQINLGFREALNCTRRAAWSHFMYKSAIMQRCFVAKLQKRLVDNETSPDFPEITYPFNIRVLQPDYA